jgi:hypothetical protein
LRGTGCGYGGQLHGQKRCILVCLPISLGFPQGEFIRLLLSCEKMEKLEGEDGSDTYSRMTRERERGEGQAGPGEARRERQH